MKKTYYAPILEEVGAISALTAAFGTSTRQDFSEFPQIEASNGSFDVCDGNPNNNANPDFCEGR